MKNNRAPQQQPQYSQLPQQQQQEEQIQKDPMELDENFFEKQSIDAEENFLANYAQPPVIGKPGITEEDDDDLDDDQNDDDNDDNDDDLDDFKFDDALAEAEKQELEELNQKLGTNYTDLKELKDALKKEETVDQEKEINEERAYINYFKTILNPKEYPDERLVFEDEKMIAQDEGKDITDPEVLEEINSKVAGLKENGVLKYAANTIRQSVKAALEKKESKVNAYDDSKKMTEQQKSVQRKEALQDSINEIYKAGTFLGITPTKEDMIQIYKDLNSNKHIEHLNSNPKDAVSFALFKKYQNVIEKNLNKPNYKDGVKNTLEEIGLTGSQQTVKKAKKEQDSNDDQKSYFDRFVQ